MEPAKSLILMEQLPGSCASAVAIWRQCWYRRAAETGNVAAARSLSCFYMTGAGVPKDEGRVCAFGSCQSRSDEDRRRCFCETNPILSAAIEAALRATLEAL